MPNILPFRAWLYSKPYHQELDRLISPPYDVISADLLEELRNKHSYNSVKLSLTDSAEDPDRYKKLKDRFQDWKQKNVFERAPTPAFYLIEEKFSVGGKERIRLGFVGLLEVSDFSKKEVLPHERTLSGPKKDRLSLLKEMGAELSQIFLCYQDPGCLLESIHEIESTKAPHMKIPKAYGVERKMWLLSDPAQTEALRNLIKERSVLIADGHHRYETAVNFKNEDQTLRSQYVQGYFTNLNAPHFSILPIHRIFSLPKPWNFKSFTETLKQSFEVSNFEAGLDLDALNSRKSNNHIQFLMKFGDESPVQLVSRKKINEDDAEIFALQKNIFDDLFQWNVADIPYDTLKYEHETEDFKKTLLKMPNGVGIFLPPTDLELVMRLAQRGERMPQKSTFFFPKIATGLVNYELGLV